MDREALEKKVREGLEEIADNISREVSCILNGPSWYDWPEVAGSQEDTDKYPEGAKAWTGQVYGSSYGPDLHRIISLDIGLTDEEERETAEWDLPGELEKMVWEDLPQGIVYMEDNCLWFRYVNADPMPEEV